MAEEKKPIRLITYGDNQYSFDALQKAVLDNFNGYASKFGYGRNKFMKDYQGLTELLRQIQSDPNVTFEAGRINFSNDYANERGAFGKTRNNSKHYKHPAWMILDTLQGMTPYEEPKAEKKKVSRAKLQSEFKDLLGVASIDDIPKSYRKRILTEALNSLQKRYDFSNPNDWEFEENFGADYFNNMFTNARTALDTTETSDDDNYYLYTLFGLNKPTQKEESKSNYEGDKARFINGLVQRGISEEVATRYWDSNVEEKIIKPYIEQFFSNAPTQSSTTTSSTGASSTSESEGIGVTASSSNPQAGSVKSGGSQDQPESETTTPSETTSSNYKTWIEQYRKLKTTEEKKKHFKSFNSNWTDIPKGNGPDGFYRDTKGRVHAPEILSKKSGGYLKLLKNYKDNGRR